MCGEGRHFKSKIIKFDVPRLSVEGLYKIPFIGLMDWRGKLEEPIITVAETGTPEIPACVWAEITYRTYRADRSSVHGIKMTLHFQSDISILLCTTVSKVQPEVFFCTQCIKRTLLELGSTMWILWLAEWPSH
jgi:hypothetical protein